MSETVVQLNHLSWIKDKKTAPMEQPWCKIEDPIRRWSWWIYKRYSNDQTAEFSRWFLGADLGMTYGMRELGDTYVAEVVATGSHLAEVDGREPTDDEILEYADFRSRVRTGEMPF